MKAIFLTSLVLLLGLSQRAYSIPYRPLSSLEKQKYTPSGVGIHDNVQFSAVVESYLQDNIQLLAPYNEVEKSLSVPGDEYLANIWRTANSEAQELLQRLRGTLGIDFNDIYSGLKDRRRGESYVHALLRNQELKMSAQYCSRMPLRKNKTVRFNYKTGLNIPIRYVLKRNSETAYQALLNLNVVDPARPANGRKTLDKIKSCMALINPYLKGPNGKTLEIKVYGPHEVGSLKKFDRPEQLEIKVAPDTERRGHAFLYRNSWDCDTITHEVLHLLGLVDEYLEDGVYENNSTCRVVPSHNTIMGELTTFFPRVVKRTIKCECSTSSCKALTSNVSQAEIERIAEKDFPCVSIAGKKIGNRYTNVSPDGKSMKDGNVFYFVQKNDLTSLLTEVQFNRIISGYCPTTVPNYAKCSIYSQLGAEDMRCQGRPAECVNEANFSGIPF